MIDKARANHLVLLSLAAAVALTACKREGASEPKKAAVADTTELWKRAPDGAVVGIVVAPGAPEMLHAGLLQALASVRALPDIGKDIEGAKAKEPKVFDAILTAAGPASIGVDLSRGAALFFDRSGSGLAVLPVVDPAKFRVFVGGAAEGDLDIYDDSFCKMFDGRYLCSNRRDMMKGLGTHAGLPRPGKDMQGHIEMWADAKGLPGFPPGANVEQINARAVLERGGVTVDVRAVAQLPLDPSPKGPSKLLSEQSAKGATGVMALNLSGVLAQFPVPPEAMARPLPGGVTLGALLEGVSGEMLGRVYPRAVVFELGLVDPAPMRKLLALCSLAKQAPGVSDVKTEGNKCSAMFDPTKLPGGPAKAPTFPITVEIADDRAVLTLGEGTGSGAVSPFVAPHIDKPGQVVAWGRGSLLAPEVADMLDTPEIRNELRGPDAQLAAWALAHLAETGLSIRAESNAVHMSMRVRTTWSNSDKVVAAIEPHIYKMVTGQPTDSAAISKIAADNKGSMLRADIEAGPGLMAPAFLGGVLAAIAIPAFTKYMNKSKGTEARFMVKKLADGARMHYLDAKPATGSLTPAAPSFPKVSTPVTPPLGTCCQQGGKCAPDAVAWNTPTWVQLQFSVDDPHYYSYQYIASADGQAFTARAYGDLDCDGQYSTFEMQAGADLSQPLRVTVDINDD